MRLGGAASSSLRRKRSPSAALRELAAPFLRGRRGALLCLIALPLVARALATMPVGLASGCLTGIAMDAAPLAPGAASAVIGLVHAAFGAAMPPVIGLGGTDPAFIMAVSLLGCAVLALLCARAARPRPALRSEGATGSAAAIPR